MLPWQHRMELCQTMAQCQGLSLFISSVCFAARSTMPTDLLSLCGPSAGPAVSSSTPLSLDNTRGGFVIRFHLHLTFFLTFVALLRL